MLNTNGSYRFKADIFFPWLLLCTLITALALTWWQVDALTSAQDWRLVQSWSAENYLAVGLTLWTLLTLAWRIWFACRYRSYAPLSDSACQPSQSLYQPTTKADRSYTPFGRL